MLQRRVDWISSLLFGMQSITAGLCIFLTAPFLVVHGLLKDSRVFVTQGSVRNGTVAQQEGDHIGPFCLFRDLERGLIAGDSIHVLLGDNVHVSA